MIRALGLSLLLLLGSVTLAAIEPYPFDDPNEQQRFRSLLASIRCLVCQNQSLSDSDAPLATDLREEVYRMMGEGQSNAEIEGFLTDRYGDFVLYRPPMRPSTYALWFGPPLVLLLGAIGIVIILRRRTAGAQSAPVPEEDL